MLLLGYFEGIDSDRGIAWRCADSLSGRSFLGLPLTAKTPDYSSHSSLSRIRQRLTPEVHEAVFKFVLQVLSDHDLLDTGSVAVDGTTLEANAALKSIVRRKGGDSYKEYLKKLAKEMGIEEPTQEDLSKLDRKRKKKIAIGTTCAIRGFAPQATTAMIIPCESSSLKIKSTYAKPLPNGCVAMAMGSTRPGISRPLTCI
jgi:hypothetical protein